MFGGRKYFNPFIDETLADTFLYSSSTAVKGRAQGTPLLYTAVAVQLPSQTAV